MKKYKQYIIGALLLLGGLAVGWILKPSSSVAENHNHEVMSGSGDVQDDEIWTCSMHPQIRQNEFGICPICEMDLIPLDNSMGNDDPTVLQMSNEAAKLAQVETFVVGKNSNAIARKSSIIKVDGSVELDERTVKSQTAHLAGRIESMAVTFEGQYVSKGQKIASIYSTELLAASQELITAAQYNDRVEGLKDAAIKKLKNWKISDAQIQSILTKGQPMETINIYADHGGYVLSKKLSQGDYVRQGQSLYTVGSTSNVWLVFDVFESDMSGVQKGSEVVFTTPSLSNEEFQAKVTYIDPLLNSNSRTTTVRAEISNRSNSLKPGMLLNGKITTKKSTSNKANAPLTIPNTAILWTGKKSVVYVQLSDTEVPSYEYREVKVSNRSNEYSTIMEGLEEGEEVVSHGAFVIDAAAQLNNNMSMMNKSVTIKKDEQSDVVPSYVDVTPVAFKEQLDGVMSKYVELKNTLVNTDAMGASLAANMLLDEVKKVDMTLLEGDAHLYWMDQLKAINSHTELIKNSEDVEYQRNQFDFLSQAIIQSVKAFGTNEKIYYVQYCPMAKGNQGADWISTEKEIRNPYFGDKMMKCGSVKLELE